MVRLSQIRKTLLILILVALAAGGGYWYGKRQSSTSTSPVSTIKQQLINQSPPSEYQDVDFSLFWETWKRLENSYLDPQALDTQKMVYGAISGLVSSLDDPYTVFLPPDEQQQTQENLEGAFGGVGIQLGYKDKTLAVIAPLDGTPADKAGVKAGDLILHITDRQKGIDTDTDGISLPDAVTYIRGPEGTPITLTLFREGKNEPFPVEVTRSTVVIESVKLAFQPLPSGKQVAHLKLSRFSEHTQEEWDKAVADILGKSAQNQLAGIVLDLRNNPGGFLQTAVDLTSDFVDNGQVVIQEGRGGYRDSYPANPGGRLTQPPLVVLVNGGSASAAEIMTGALADHKRAQIVGEKTFGKGTVQEPQELPGGAGLHITIAHWLTPSGTSIQENGITPAVKVEDDPQTESDEQLAKAIQVLTGQSVATTVDTNP